MCKLIKILFNKFNTNNKMVKDDMKNVLILLDAYPYDLTKDEYTYDEYYDVVKNAIIKVNLVKDSKLLDNYVISGDSVEEKLDALRNRYKN